MPPCGPRWSEAAINTHQQASRWRWGRALAAGVVTGAAVGFVWSWITDDTVDFAFMNNHVLLGALVFILLFLVITGLVHWSRRKPDSCDDFAREAIRRNRILCRSKLAGALFFLFIAKVASAPSKSSRASSRSVSSDVCSPHPRAMAPDRRDLSQMDGLQSASISMAASNRIAAASALSFKY